MSINREKIQELAIKYKKTNSQKDKDALILECAQLVKVIAHSLYVGVVDPCQDVEDYEIYGVFGLLDAIEKYNPDTSVDFYNYASLRVRGHIIDEMRSMSFLPRSVMEKQKKYKGYVLAAEQEYGATYTKEQLLSASKISEDEFNTVEDSMKYGRIFSLDHMLMEYCDDDGGQKEVLSDSSFMTHDKHQIFVDEIQEMLAYSLEKLTERERTVIELIYYEEMTISEIALTLGVSESRISQINKKALIKMKASLSKYMNGNEIEGIMSC